MNYRKTVVFVVLVLLSYLPFVAGSTIGFVFAGAAFFYAASKLLPFAEISGLGELGLFRHNRWSLFLASGFLIGCLFNVAVYVALSSSGIVQLELPAAPDILLVTFLALLTAGFTAFAEEIIFRGYIAKILRPHLSWNWVVLAICVLFTLYHLPQWGLPLPYWVRYFIMGIVFAIPLIATKSLWMSIGIHLGGNFTFYVLLTESGLLATEKRERVIESIGWVSVGAAFVLLGFIALMVKTMRIDDSTVNY